MPNKSDEELILEVNERFYRALGTRDLSLMDTVFVRDERAGCTHPGWVMLRGWEAIRQSWENFFDPEDRLAIKLHNVTVDIKGRRRVRYMRSGAHVRKEKPGHDERLDIDEYIREDRIRLADDNPPRLPYPLRHRRKREKTK